MLDLRAHFRRFLDADPARLHLAAHSHHLWPDVTRDAQLRAWDDAARLADGKWERVLGPVWREAQRHVARHLSLPDPRTVAFGQNTFEFWLRLLSCFDRPIRVLATDGEFHSFRRLSARLAEDGLLALELVAAEPHASFAERFAAAAARGGHDLVLFSQVFYGTGFEVAELGRLAAAVADPATFVVVDGYHGFLAVPTDLAPIAERVFYMAGGYKYAMAGEGAAFLHCPSGYGARPRATGWFADFAALEGTAGPGVAYPTDARRFLGATFDPSGLYRFNAAMRWLAEIGVDATAVRAHAHALQRAFIDALDVDLGELVVPLEEPRRGSFLTFRHAGAATLHARLAAAGIVTDLRGDRLRIGFGLYHAAEDAPRAARRIAAALT